MKAKKLSEEACFFSRGEEGRGFEGGGRNNEGT